MEWISLVKISALFCLLSRADLGAWLHLDIDECGNRPEIEVMMLAGRKTGYFDMRMREPEGIDIFVFNFTLELAFLRLDLRLKL